ncbi:MAG: hypothetical protein WAM55_02005 [Methylovirgula sp.]
MRADIVVTPLYAPPGCAAALILDRAKLKETGAVTHTARGSGWAVTTARAPDEDRPWSPAPKPRWGKAPQGENAATTVSDDPSAPLE